MVTRRIAQGIAVLCAIGGALLAVEGDWADTALVALLGALALVTARMMTWRLRPGHDWSMAGGINS
ncbi:hypothetical protein [Mycolicibacterium sp.]|uniref:hypothetical protein n=1 Tax=Mycolicibacterium sp. TaxID=2320850 RepID=UPI001A1F2EC9|nr:hypothetical protein [Mycolicibacterium sp.]MBJ7336463.1 hypothetical protein [Mycolicibacterium sp.]